MSSSSSTSTVLDYLRRQQRPYSLIQIFDNLKGAVPKSQIQKILDAQSSEENDGEDNEIPLVRKTFGKSTIYWPRQLKSSEMSESAVKALGEKIEILKGEVNALRKESSRLTEEIAAVKATPENSQLEAAIQLESAKVTQLEKEFSAIQKGKSEGKSLTQSDFDDQQRKFNLMLSEWKKRRKGALELADMILEHMNVKKEKFFSDRGIEFDANGKTPADFQSLYKKLPDLPKVKNSKGSAASKSSGNSKISAVKKPSASSASSSSKKRKSADDDDGEEKRGDDENPRGEDGEDGDMREMSESKGMGGMSDDEGDEWGEEKSSKNSPKKKKSKGSAEGGEAAITKKKQK